MTKAITKSSGLCDELCYFNYVKSPFLSCHEWQNCRRRSYSRQKTKGGNMSSRKKEGSSLVSFLIQRIRHRSRLPLANYSNSSPFQSQQFFNRHAINNRRYKNCRCITATVLTRSTWYILCTCTFHNKHNCYLKI